MVITTNKIHRIWSVIAAIFMIFSRIFYLITQLASIISEYMFYQDFQMLILKALSVVLEIVTSVFLIIVLLRGKKDNRASILLLFPAACIVVSSIISIISLFDDFELFYLLNLLPIAANWVFYAMLLQECIKPGKISTGSYRLLLILAPCFCAVYSIVQICISNINYYGFEAEFLTASLIGVVSNLITRIPYILMGLSFSIPVKQFVFNMDVQGDSEYIG